MSFNSLRERQKSYEEAYDHKLLRRVPVMIRVDGANFTRFCRNLQKPYEPLILEALAQSMLTSISDMSGAIFGYAQSDEITFVLRNDQSLDSDPWHDNKIQTIVSRTSSMVTENFNDIVKNIDPKLPLIGKAYFDCLCWPMPSIGEVVNNIIDRQQSCINDSVNRAAISVLSDKFGKKNAYRMLNYNEDGDKNIMPVGSKIDLMYEHCGVLYEDDFPSSYRRGIGVYKVPTLFNSTNGPVTKNKWKLDWDLPIFGSDGKDFLHHLITTGHDVFREDFIK